MVGRTNVGSGGNIFAVISVSYPVGATCTCSNGTRTLKARGTSGYFVFNVPSIGTWTVEAHDDYSTTSSSVIITKEGQTENVSLAFTRIPAEYQEVEFLQSSGTQYIDTGVSGSFSSLKAIVVFLRVSSTSGYDNVFGTDASGSNQCFGFQTYQLNGHSYIATNKSATLGTVTLINNNKYDCEFYYDGSVSYRKIGTEEYSVENSVGALSLSNIHLFKSNSTNDTFGNYKIYSFKLYANNNLIRNMIPCYRKSDNEAGFYDVVNGVFYTNSGTGTFAIGKDVNYEVINSKGFAFIQCTYPAGSSCTCTKGETTLSAKSGNGEVIFGVTEAGTWTVTCSNSETEESDEATVDISTEGETQTVKLSYDLNIFKNGILSYSVSTQGTATSEIVDGNWVITSSSPYAGGIYLTNPLTFPIEEYKSLTIVLNSCYSWNTPGIKFGLSNSKPNMNKDSGTDSTSWAAYKKIEDTNNKNPPVSGTFTVDISSVTGSKYVSLTLSSTTGTDAYANIKEAYFSKNF